MPEATEAHLAQFVGDKMAEWLRRDLDRVESGPVQAPKRIEESFTWQSHDSRVIAINYGGQRRFSRFAKYQIGP